MRVIVSIFALLAAVAASANTVTIDFTDPVIESGSNDPFVTEGYLFSFERGVTSPAYFTTVPNGITFCPDCILTVTSVADLSFDFSSINLWSFNTASTFELTGVFTDGSTTTTQLLFIGPETPPPGGLNAAGIDYTLNWTGLTELKISSLAFEPTGLNSLTLSEIPLPATVWLFASALAAVGWHRRRQP